MAEKVGIISVKGSGIMSEEQKTTPAGESYEPIDCGLHDELLARATMGRPTTITYHDEQGEKVVVEDVIEDVYTRQGAEYLRLGDGAEVRLDKIVDFHGQM